MILLISLSTFQTIYPKYEKVNKVYYKIIKLIFQYITVFSAFFYGVESKSNEGNLTYTL